MGCCAAVAQHVTITIHPILLAPTRFAGDDPNYWMALTQQADAEYVSKKVRKMLAEINQPGSNQVHKGCVVSELCGGEGAEQQHLTSSCKQSSA